MSGHANSLLEAKTADSVVEETEETERTPEIPSMYISDDDEDITCVMDTLNYTPSVSDKHMQAISRYILQVVTNAAADYIQELVSSGWLMRPADFEIFIRPERYRSIPPPVHLPFLPQTKIFRIGSWVGKDNADGAPPKVGWPAPFTNPLVLGTHAASILKRFYGYSGNHHVD